jgi:hypothetical protein
MSRARFLSGAAALVALAALAPSRAAAQSGPDASLTLDVACDGRTWRYDAGTAGPPTRGTTFIVSGIAFPAGTFARGRTTPDSPGRIGIWVCRGTYLFDLDEIVKGAEPHVYTTQHFQFDDGSILATEGLEGGAQTFTRVVLGGAGKYAGVRGSVAQLGTHTNNTVLPIASGVEVPAPNYVFRFSFT